MYCLIEERHKSLGLRLTSNAPVIFFSTWNNNERKKHTLMNKIENADQHQFLRCTLLMAANELARGGKEKVKLEFSSRAFHLNVWWDENEEEEEEK